MTLKVYIVFKQRFKYENDAAPHCFLYENKLHFMPNPMTLEDCLCATWRKCAKHYKQTCHFVLFLIACGDCLTPLINHTC